METTTLIQYAIQGITWINQKSTQSRAAQREEEFHQKKMELYEAQIEAARNRRLETEKSLKPNKPMDGLNSPNMGQNGTKKIYSSYLQEFGQESEEDVSVGCVPCTRAHLATVSSALERGDTHTASEEIMALLEYDLTPEKLAATPEADRQVLSKYADRLQEMKQKVQPEYPELVLASASTKEAVRFAREDGVDHPEAQLRVQRAEEAVNGLERITLSPENVQQLSTEQRKQVEQALPEIRRVRQDLINHTHTAEDLERVSAKLGTLSRQLNFLSTPQEQTRQLHKEAVQLNTEFRQDVLRAWKERNDRG